MLTSLDYHSRRAQAHDTTHRSHKIGLARKTPRLALVHKQHVYPLHYARKRVLLPLDPEVHGVQRHQLWSRVHLIEDPELKLRVDVGKEEIRLLAMLRTQCRREMREHVQLRIKRVARVCVLRAI